jgi:flavin-dependent dehydrogenase
MFDQYLIDKAIEKGAELVEEKVVALKKKNDLWYLKTEKQTHVTKNLIGADGIHSLVRRKLIGPLSRKDTGSCLGYFASKSGDEDITIKFSPYHKGYLWVIPRGQNTFFGIGTTAFSGSSRLKEELDNYIKRNYPKISKISSWAALIPSIKDMRTFRKPLAGRNWIIIGDAAGHVDPVSGEGILYALLDGQFAARAVQENSLQLFDRFWRREFEREFSIRGKISKWMYNKSILELMLKTSNFHQKFAVFSIMQSFRELL